MSASLSAAHDAIWERLVALAEALHDLAVVSQASPTADAAAKLAAHARSMAILAEALIVLGAEHAHG